ncbi:hypothetical protein [Campylobacter sp.]|uniref:hypothetical protein n=1 Tax=Campylobacter sp. TaxID=205 RepID=UPI002AA61AB7|nr:hypothetical protein [Campylobacter sp.]
MLCIRWLLRTRWVALFSLKALRSSVTLQKLLHSFSAACALKIQRKIFAAATPPTASAAALKLKIALKSWSLVFTAATA